MNFKKYNLEEEQGTGELPESENIFSDGEGPGQELDEFEGGY
jgi:hypothetical protein